MVLTRVLLAVGIIAIVPLGLRLAKAPTPGRAAASETTHSLLLAIPMAVLAVALPPSPWAGLLGVPWLLMAMHHTRVALSGLVDQGVRALSLRTTALVAAPGFWTVGAAWLVLDSLGVDPMGVGAPIVTLTAVHFHFAGFAAVTVLAWTERGLRQPTPAQSRAVTASVAGILVGPPLVAIGFATYRPAQILGATVLMLSLWSWSFGSGAAVTDEWSTPARRLWHLARLSVLIGMPLALWWAIGSVTGIPAPTIPTMALTHGIIQGIGFSLGAMLALNLTSVDQMSHPHGSMGTVRTHVR